MMRGVVVWIAGLLMMAAGEAREVRHPRLLVHADQLEAMRLKVVENGWARAAYAELKKRVDRVAVEVEKKPDWLVSRLMMNWETHYMLPVTMDSRWIGGEGRAPVPTPRFAGARDWNSNHTVPRHFKDWKPYNCWGDDVWLVSKDENEGEWVHPSITGLAIESANERVMRLAAEAAFLYWMTGEERYAKVAAPVLWTYMEGFSHVLPPRIEDPESDSGRIIGTTSFEVIHEEILVRISQCYDFIHGYLVEQGKDPMVVQKGIKRMADRVIEGGQIEGNWNLFQARIIAHGGLVLEPDEHYADGKGKDYYVNVVLNARLPTQLGLMHVVEKGYDPVTALWPEAPGYGFETTASVLDVANLMAGDPGGRKLLANPVIERALLAQAELTHPNGLSIGLGDTINVRINTKALEMLIAAAREQGKVEQERRLTALLMKEIEDQGYVRKRQSDLYSLTRFVGELHGVSASGEVTSRSYFGEPLNLLMMRLPGEGRENGLSAAMFGTAGGHAHTSGLAVELYGAGRILGADPGRGSSYWQRDQRHYYSRPPAHNTVIPNGNADYPLNPPRQLTMKVECMEPGPGEDGLSENVGFARASFQYLKPAAAQRRTLAMVRTGGDSAFYFDLFRSRAVDPKREGHHDYLYHGMGQQVEVSGPDGAPLPLESCELLGELHGDMAGYDFFREERSVESDRGVRARFELAFPDGSRPTMDLWMMGGEDRRVFSLEAPANRAIRGGLPSALQKLPMPTLLVRQDGEAWHRPFVAVYEPFFGKQGARIREVRHWGNPDDMQGVTAVVVEGKDSRVLVLESEDPGVEVELGGIRFSGAFGVVIGSPGRVDEVYLGEGKSIGFGGLQVTAEGVNPVSACLKRDKNGLWTCRADGPVLFTGGDSPELRLPGVFEVD